MSVRQIRNHGRKVWQARVAYKGLRASAIRVSKGEARDAESLLLQELKGKAAQAEGAALRPATLKTLLEFYAQDMQARGKGDDSLSRVEFTGRAIERLMPELLERPVTEIGDAEIFAFRNARARECQRSFNNPHLWSLKTPRPLPGRRGGVRCTNRANRTHGIARAWRGTRSGWT